MLTDDSSIDESDIDRRIQEHQNITAIPKARRPKPEMSLLGVANYVRDGNWRLGTA